MFSVITVGSDSLVHVVKSLCFGEGITGLKAEHIHYDREV